ncbi:YdcF family protein [Corynebacterium tapiri]|uniref:YdcF family protein n=1 Tax=Corynebacterium tapiri TaxID=1448266 RepID=UPI001FE86D23|nr:YdcF family protein [Corynebacterium tapiri]
MFFPPAYPLRILATARRRRRLTAEVDSLAVMGTAQYDGRPSPQFAARLEHVADLASRFPDAHVYTLGANLPGDRFTEAEVGRKFLVARGVEKQRITALPEGNDSRASLKALYLQQPGRTVVVTDPHHVLRTEILAQQEGLQAIGSPAPGCPSRFPRKSWFRTLAHECGGLLVADVSARWGNGAADRVEELLRNIESRLRPSRRARHDHLRTLKG